MSPASRPVPASRVRRANDRPVRPGGRYVLYWMSAQRRPSWSFALDHAIGRCEDLGVGLVVLEALRVDYPHASDRLHRFVLDGMRANAAAFSDLPVRYHPYVEDAPGAGKGLLEALAQDAALVVADEWPGLFLPHMLAAAARRLDVALDVVDGCGLLPLSASAKEAPTAYVFRRHLQKTLPAHLEEAPRRAPFARRRLGPAPRIRREVLARWPAASAALLAGRGEALARLPIDHGVGPVALEGGPAAAGRRLARFVRDALPQYAAERNEPEADATSGLSPWLHFGHLSVHEVFDRVVRSEGWTLDRLSPRADGRREGWWGLGSSAEAWFDQLVTWRELGYHFARHRPDHDRYGSVPDWARVSLARHVPDPRTHLYDLDALEGARTHDALWNAAQMQLRTEGRIHGYLRMLWGKKVIEWTRTPEEAWEVLVHLNDRWAVDGRDPNSYSGIGWCFGRHDRPWAPERPVLGVVRYMSSLNTARKLRVRGYVAAHAPRPAEGGRAGAPGPLLPGLGPAIES